MWGGGGRVCISQHFTGPTHAVTLILPATCMMCPEGSVSPVACVACCARLLRLVRPQEWIIHLGDIVLGWKVCLAIGCHAPACAPLHVHASARPLSERRCAGVPVVFDDPRRACAGGGGGGGSR